MRTNNQIITMINELRQEQDLSISELARRVGMAKSALSRYFNKTREFPLNRINIFAAALHTTPEYLLGFNNEKNVAKFKNRLVEALDSKGITKAELARRTGIGRNSITDYTKGKYEAKQDNIYLIAKALDVNEAWLMGYDTSPERIKLKSKEKKIVKIFTQLNTKNQNDTYKFAKQKLEEQKDSITQKR